MEQKYAVAVDIGGTKIAAIVADLAAQRIAAAETIETKAGQGSDALVRRVFDLIDRVMKRSSAGRPELLGVGLAVAGMVDSERGEVKFCPNLPWRDLPLGDLAARAFGTPVYLENDANSAALGEFYLGAGVGGKNLIYLTVSTGIGGGIIIDGRLYRGSSFAAGEIGHIVLNPRGPQCGCGRQGCLEAMASGTFIARAAAERVGANAETALRAVAREHPLTAKDVAAAAANGDGPAGEILAEAFTNLGLGLASLVNVLNPELAIIGGGLSNIPELIPTVRAVVQERSLEAAMEKLEIVPAKLGPEAGLLGVLGVVCAVKGRQLPALQSAIQSA